jgi:hypothetical protein
MRCTTIYVATHKLSSRIDASHKRQSWLRAGPNNALPRSFSRVPSKAMQAGHQLET